MITIDLESANGYPKIDVPHPIDFHDPPVTSIKYVHDPKSLMISSLQRRQKKREPAKAWPLDGGTAEGQMSSELIITGMFMPDQKLKDVPRFKATMMDKFAFGRATG